MPLREAGREGQRTDEATKSPMQSALDKAALQASNAPSDPHLSSLKHIAGLLSQILLSHEHLGQNE